MSEYELDASGLLCPLPVIKTQDKIHNLKPGDILKVICTDPGALYDIPAWCRINNHEILQKITKHGQILLKIRVN